MNVSTCVCFYIRGTFQFNKYQWRVYRGSQHCLDYVDASQLQSSVEKHWIWMCWHGFKLDSSLAFCFMSRKTEHKTLSSVWTKASERASNFTASASRWIFFWNAKKGASKIRTTTSSLHILLHNSLWKFIHLSTSYWLIYSLLCCFPLCWKKREREREIAAQIIDSDVLNFKLMCGNLDGLGNGVMVAWQEAFWEKLACGIWLEAVARRMTCLSLLMLEWSWPQMIKDSLSYWKPGWHIYKQKTLLKGWGKTMKTFLNETRGWG